MAREFEKPTCSSSYEYRELYEYNLELEEKLKIAMHALDAEACWGQGQVVNGKFDSPGSAIAAREALAKIESVK